MTKYLHYIILQHIYVHSCTFM